MNRAAVIFASVFLSGFLTACSTYQHVVIDSTLPKDKFENDAFVRSDGDATFHYSFGGPDNLFNIKVTNDGEEELYLDVTGSAVFLNGNPFPLKPIDFRKYITSPTGTPMLLTVYFSGDGTGKASEVLRIPPGSQAVVTAGKLNISFRNELDFHRNPQKAALDHPHLIRYRIADLSEGGNVYEVRLRLSDKRGFETSRFSTAVFNESHVYRTSSDPTYFPLKASYVQAVRKDGSGSGGFWLALTAAMVILAAVSGDGDTGY